ncbi:DUF397 domain-containing protein [Spongiactinospora sp. 9N601]|uniref:DUF397 domain-containing protein n=1 Tax=Spongiactinospora sp. 9N601 TaxID=3375149 RepID=UPI0037B8CB5C
MDQHELMRATFSGSIWRKSTRSGNTGGNCVEVADGVPGLVGVRDSKDPAGAVLAFSRNDWRAFLEEIKAGAFH